MFLPVDTPKTPCGAGGQEAVVQVVQPVDPKGRLQGRQEPPQAPQDDGRVRGLWGGHRMSVGCGVHQYSRIGK